MKDRNFKDPKYIAWRKSVYKRDKYMCQFPNCHAKKSLNAHHIKRYANFPLLRYEKSNGITLCREHHKFVTGREEEFEQMFIIIVNGKNTRNVDVARFRYTGHGDIRGL